MKILDTKKLEETLIKNWSNFIDTSRLIAFVLKCIRDQADIKKQKSKPPQTQTQFTISSFTPNVDNFIVSVEYTCPSDNGTIIGTCVCKINLLGNIENLSTLGTLFQD